MATGEEIRKFWAQTHVALAKVDMDARVEPVESSDPLVMEGGIKTRTICRVIIRTVMPVFEKLRALKSIIVYPDLEHEYRTDFTTHAKAWMDRYLR